MVQESYTIILKIKGDDLNTLREEFNRLNGLLDVDMSDDIKLPYLNDEFHFENGKCVSISFSNV